MTRVKLLDASDPHKPVSYYAMLPGINSGLLKKRGLEVIQSPSFGLGYLNQTYFSNESPMIGSHVNFGSCAAFKIYKDLKYSLLDLLGVQDKIHLHNTEADFAAFGLILRCR